MENTLFPSENKAETISARLLTLPDCRIEYFPAIFNHSESDALFRELLETTGWKREQVKIFGKTHFSPRLIAWYGAPGVTYAYSGLTLAAQGWLPPILQIKSRIERTLAVSFNSVLLNYYRDGADSMGRHSDDETALGPEPIIASVSLGGTRVFHLQHKTEPQYKIAIPLSHGDLLFMAGLTQRNYVHWIPKTKRPVAPRINLTFRNVLV